MLSKKPLSCSNIKWLMALFQRSTAQFRNWITVDVSAGISGEGGFKAEAGRYSLFAALNCLWAHSTLIYRWSSH